MSDENAEVLMCVGCGGSMTRSSLASHVAWCEGHPLHGHVATLVGLVEPVRELLTRLECDRVSAVFGVDCGFPEDIEEDLREALAAVDALAATPPGFEASVPVERLPGEPRKAK